MMGSTFRNLRVIALVATLLAASFSYSSASTTKPLAPLALPENTFTGPTSPGEFTFVAGGDNRPPGHGDPMPPSCGEIFTEIGIIHPDLVIWTGDEIEGYDDTLADADGEYKSFLALAGSAGVPIVAIPGNHETAFVPALEAVYKQDMGALYGSFDYGGSHFIGLDSSPVEPDGKVHDQSISPEELDWLKADLAANQDATNIFVFFHHYMFGMVDPDNPKSKDTGLADPAQRDVLHQLFVQYHVRAVFNGHAHLSYHVNKDGIDYYIAGNAGAPMDAAPENGGYLGYTLVHVDGAKIWTENMIPWTVLLRTVSGNDGKSKTAQVAVSNYSFSDLDLRGVSVIMPKATGYVAAAETRYKGKSPAVDIAIDHVEPGPTSKTQRVVLAFKSTQARTTYITVSAAK
jgi:hypothetical protein